MSSFNPLFLANLQRRPSGLLVPPSALTWEPEITTTQTSGTYYYINRNFKYLGADPNKGAITNTGNGTARHICIGCRFWTNSHAVKSLAAAGFEFYGCRSQGINPNVYGQPMGCFFEGTANWFIAENNHVEYMGGMRLVGADADYVRIRYNRALNIIGSKSNGTGLAGWAGFIPEPHNPENVNNQTYAKFMSLAQFNSMTLGANGAGAGTGGISRSEIGWNESVSYPGQSRNSDHISFFASGGVPGGNVLVHHNFLQGMWRQDYLDATHSGRGIQNELTGSKSWYKDIEDNTIVGIPGAIEIHGENSYINVRRNKAFYSRAVGGQTLPTIQQPYTGEGTGINQVWEDNAFTWYTPGYIPETQFVTNPGNTGNSAGSNWSETSPCSEALEAAQLAIWRAQASAALASLGKSIGNSIPAW